ncbi:unnamed protein product [Musa hybrid cultivar]
MKDKKDKEWNRSWNGKPPRAKTKGYACGGLREACATDNYKYVLIAFVNKFGGNQDPQLNLAGHCDPNTNDSTFLSKRRHLVPKGLQLHDDALVGKNRR